MLGHFGPVSIVSVIPHARPASPACAPAMSPARASVGAGGVAWSICIWAKGARGILAELIGMGHQG